MHHIFSIIHIIQTIYVPPLMLVGYVILVCVAIRTLSMTEMYSLYCGLPGVNSVDFNGNCCATSLLILALHRHQYRTDIHVC